MSADDVTGLLSGVQTWQQVAALLVLVIGFLAWRWLKGVAAQIQDVHHEVHPNSGKSLADAVNRIDANVNNLTERVEQLEQTRGFRLWK